MGTLQNLFWFALLLGSLVVVHELGHFLVAKACGVKVLRFSVGFGPRILGFTRGETEYRLALLPLGGYVKMAGDVPGEELAPEDAKRGFLVQTPWKRALIVAAGPAFNLIFPLILYFFVFLGYPQPGTRVAWVAPSMPAASAGLRRGDVIHAVNGHRTESYDSLLSQLEGKPWEGLRLQVDRGGQRQELELHGAQTLSGAPIDKIQLEAVGFGMQPQPPVLGVLSSGAAEHAGLRTFDRVLAVNGKGVSDVEAMDKELASAQGHVTLDVARFAPVLLPGVKLQTFNQLHFDVPLEAGKSGLAAMGAELTGLYVGEVTPDSAADKAGVKMGDRLVAIDGKELPTFEQFLLTTRSLGEQPFAFTLRRGGETRTVTVKRQQMETQGDVGQKEERLLVGILPYQGFLTGETRAPETVRLTPAGAWTDSLHMVPQVISKIGRTFWYLLNHKVASSNLGGPVMLYNIAAKTAQLGMDRFLEAIAIISINLGLVNLVPIPILDGFHLVAAAWEAIRKRPIPDRARELANFVGFAMLVLLMGYALFNDVSRLF